MGKTQKPNQETLTIREEETPQQTVARLVREQGVKPIKLAEYEKLWPEAFDPDAFNAWLTQERCARRAAAERKG